MIPGNCEPDNRLTVGVLATPADHTNDGGDNRDDEYKGQEAVAKFNPRVKTPLSLMGDWGIGAWGAFGPGWAAKARSGEANSSAGDEDSCLKSN